MSVSATGGSEWLASATSDTRHRLIPALEYWIGRMDGDLRNMCGYQLGLNSPTGAPTGELHGKLLRPTLTLLSAEAAGGTAADAEPGAIAVELLHNASLIHDDIMDGDELRRFQPTVWAHFGVPNAILAGDMLIGLGFEVLAFHEHPATRAAVSELAGTLRLIGQGQADDVRFGQTPSVTLDDYLTAITGKTAQLFGCACRMGALYAQADADVAEHIYRFGLHLGIAFQLIDDLLDIWGNPGITGKSGGSDLRARKKSAPVVAALAADGPDAARLHQIFSSDRRLQDNDIAMLAELIEKAGGRAWAQAEANRQVSLAWSQLSDGNVPTRAAAALSDLCNLIVNSDSSVV